MKRTKSIRIAIALAILSVPAFLSGCGSGSGGAAASPAVAGGAITSAGCVPLSAGGASFQASSVTFGGGMVYAGQIPSTSNYLTSYIPYQTAGYGSVVMTGAPGTSPYTTYSMLPNYGSYYGAYSPYPSYTAGAPVNFTGQSSDGAIQMSVTFGSTASPYAGYNVLAGSATGSVYLSPLVQQVIISEVETGQIPLGLNTGVYNNPYYPSSYNTATLASQICISVLALDLDVANADFAQAPNTLYLGNVYLYLNNSQHGFIMQF